MQMIEKQKIEKPFGPSGSTTGIFLFAVGVGYSFYSLMGLLLVVFGAFIGFSSVVTILDVENRRIKFSNMLFGLFPTGKWIEISSDMLLGIEHSHRGFRTYSRSNRSLDVHVNDFRIFLYSPQNRRLGPVRKFETEEAARNGINDLSLKLGLKVK